MTEPAPMKDLLPIESKVHESRIREIAEIIVDTLKDKVAFVILFGSFACGTWVRYRHVEDGLIHEYASDYDFLIITKSSKHANGGNVFDLERKVKKAIENSMMEKEVHRSHIVIESIGRVNEALEKSQYFFSDIKKEGVVLYDSGEFKLSSPKELSESQKEEITKANFEHWFDGANGFLLDCNNAIARGDYKKALFYLHQATENLYNCTLLTRGGYKPKSHDLEELNQLCAFYSHDFLTIFPKASEEQKECFDLLQKSYIDARYNRCFQVNKDQLEYLTMRVNDLKKLVEKVCDNNPSSQNPQQKITTNSSSQDQL